MEEILLRGIIVIREEGEKEEMTEWRREEDSRDLRDVHKMQGCIRVLSIILHAPLLMYV